jgi:dihydroflavonol-4-reductase
MELNGQKSMKVFLTGASGFIGGNLARKLAENGYEINALVRKSSNLIGLEGLPVKIFYGDLHDREAIANAVKGCTACFHVAARYSFWERDNSVFYLSNVEGTKNILNACRNEGVKKIIYTSSESTVKAEDYEKLNDVSEVHGLYKKTKIMAELEVNKFINEGYPVVVVAPTTPVGCWDIKPTPTGKIVLDFMQNKMPAYVNTGLNIIDVEDVALGHIAALERGTPGKKYILGNKNLMLKDIFKILSEITKIKAPTVRIPLWLALGFGYSSELFSSVLLKKEPQVPVAAVKAASKFRFFDCSGSLEKLEIYPGPVEQAFEKAVNWFKDYGYCK